MLGFGKKPVPAGWEDLSPEELAFCLKARKRRWKRELDSCAAIDRGWHRALRVICEMGMFEIDHFVVVKHALHKRDLAAFGVVARGLAPKMEADEKSWLLQEAAHWMEALSQAIAAADLPAAAVFDAVLGTQKRSESLANLLDADRARVPDYLLLCAQKTPQLWFSVRFEKHSPWLDQNRRAVIAATLLASKGYEAYGRSIVMNEDINVHSDGGHLMYRALLLQEKALAECLLDKGFDLKLYGEDLKKQLAVDGAAPAAMALLSELQRMDSGLPATADDAAGFTLGAADTVSLTRALPDGGMLTFAFNFTLRQQVVTMEKNGVLSPPAVLTFNGFDDSWQAAADALVRLGGDKGLVADKRLASGGPLLLKGNG